jgi:hypothetical protein
MSEAPAPVESSNRNLNRAVAITVVILSVAMAITKIKDDNIVQAMQADTAAKVDYWNEYQASRIKLHIEEVALTGYKLNPQAKAAADASEKAVAKYKAEAGALKKQAQDAAADYDKQGYRDDQFDLSDGFASIALAVTAISALIESWGLLSIGWGAAFFGIMFSVAGFAQLPLHPDWLVTFLT